MSNQKNIIALTITSARFMLNTFILQTSHEFIKELYSVINITTILDMKQFVF